MRWGALRRFVLVAPDDHWSADPVFALLGVILGVWVGRSRGSVILGLGVAALVWAVRELVFRLVVRTHRRPKS